MKTNFKSLLILTLVALTAFLVGYKIGKRRCPIALFINEAKSIASSSATGKITAAELLEKASAYIDAALAKVQVDIYKGQFYKQAGVFYFHNDMWKKAVSSLEKALEYFPTDSNMRYILGVSYFQLARIAVSPSQKDRFLSKSEKELKKAIEINPSFFDAYYALSINLIKQKRFEEALNHIKTALKLRPKNIEALFALGRILYELGEPEKARKTYLTIMALTKTGSKEYKKAQENANRIEEELYRAGKL